ncbi:MAG: ABC transporter substrate-binding protein [Syntrophaceae bacterium]|nr:ABC transporter substrate-binding protein [Syntrophaceae bacterium]
MNFYRILAKIFILLMVFFLACGETVIAAESPFPATLKAGEKAQPVKTSREEGSCPASQAPVGSHDRNTIGCVLPLTGRHGESGNKALDAILLAAGIFSKKNEKPWRIVAEDSQRLPTVIKNAVERLSNTWNVIAIIAIAGTAEAPDAAREAAKQKVPLIIITSTEGITNGREYVFQHFLTRPQQVGALVKYAVNNLYHTTFSILYPKDNYGIEMTKIFSTEVDRRGGKIESAVPFDKKQTDFTQELNQVVKNGINIAKNSDADNPEIQVQVPIDFEALFIPDSYQRAKMIASQLAFYDVKSFTLLGTSFWNSSDLLKKDAACLEGAVFVDSFFVNSFSPEINDFVDIYYAAYSRKPENIEALSYDTMGMIIRVLEDKTISTRKQFAAGFRQIKNYKGVTGDTSFSADRVSQKTAFILQVKDGKIEQVR